MVQDFWRSVYLNISECSGHCIINVNIMRKCAIYVLELRSYETIYVLDLK